MADGDTLTIVGGHQAFAPLAITQAVYSTTVTLTDAQVKALRAAPFELVPPTEVLGYVGTPSSLPLPIFGSIISDLQVAYTNIPSPTRLLLVWGSDFSVKIGDVTRDGAIVDTQNVFKPGSGTPGNRRITRITSMDSDNIPLDMTESFQDNGIYLTYINGDGDVTTAGALTGGDAANTLTVTVAYIVVDIS